MTLESLAPSFSFSSNAGINGRYSVQTSGSPQFTTPTPIFYYHVWGIYRPLPPSELGSWYLGAGDMRAGKSRDCLCSSMLVLCYLPDRVARSLPSWPFHGPSSLFILHVGCLLASYPVALSA
eukprot:766383-Hanusia_phi.AAC.2